MVDRTEGTIVLAAAFVKQGRGHTIPIPPALADLLDACPVDARSDLVFASPKTGRPMRGWTQLVAKVTKASGVQFGLHDLRRTFKIGLSGMGVSIEVSELALGHARSKLERI